MKSKFIKYFLIPVSLLVVVTQLTGCMMAVNTFRSPDARSMVIVPKQRPVVAIHKIEIDMKGLSIPSKEKVEQKKLLYNAILSELEKDHLWSDVGDIVKITVTKVEDSTLSTNTVQAYVEVLDAQQQLVASGVFVVTGRGVQQIEGVRDDFAEQVVNYIQKPMIKPRK